jgi:hypothetical protein
MRTTIAIDWVGLTAGVALLLATASSARAQAPARPTLAMDDQWHFMVAPYFWFTGLKGDVSVKGVASIPIDQSFSDVMKDFHFGFLGHFEGRKNRFAFATDFMYTDLHAPVAEGVPVLGQLGLETTVKSTTVEGDGFFRAFSGGRQDNPGALDVLLGVRYYSMSAQLNANLPSGSGVAGGKQSFSWVDALVGARFRAPLGSRFALIGRGDIAGFGSNFTWNLEGDIAARLSEHWSAGLGWRHMSIDYEKEGTDRKLFDLAYDGPRAWFAYAW